MKYKLLQERFGNPPGTIVYTSRMHDYGLARDDTKYTGIQHISVTLNEDGSYPFFTVPEHCLSKLL